MSFCGSCGKPTGPDDQFCKSCGAVAKASAPSASAGAPTPTKLEESAVPVLPTPAPIVPPAAPAAGIFCGVCGKHVEPGNEFCPACGAPLHHQARPAYSGAAHQNIGATVVDPREAITPVRRSHVGLWLLGAFAVLALLVIVVVAVVMSGPKPEDSLDQMRAAYLQHDQVNFDKFVDVNSVLGDWTDQSVNMWLKQQNAGAIETAAAQVVAGTLKSAYLPSLSQSVDQMVVSGTLPDQSQNGSNDQVTAFVVNFISSMVRNIASSQLTYQGVQSKTVVNNTDAVLKVIVGSSLSNQPVIVQIKMHRDGDHWRVVSVDDLAGLLNQLNITATP
jgi:hypothetical protein